MSLTRKVLITVSVIVVALIMILFFAAQTILINGYEELETEQVEANMIRIENKINDELAQILSTNQDWAYWTDTYDYVQGENPTYVEDNLDVEIITNLGINLIMFLNNDQELLYAQLVNLETGEEVPLPDDLVETIRQYEVLLTHSDENSAISGIILTSTAPMLISSQPVLTSAAEGPVGGTLIMGRFINERQITALQESLGLTFNAYDYQGRAASREIQTARESLDNSSQILVEPLSSSTVAGYSYMDGLSGDPALLVALEMSRDVLEQGQQSVSFFIMSLIILSLVAGVVLLLALRWLVLSRLNQLSTEVNAIGGDFKRRLSLESQDEFGVLSSQINTMLGELDQTHETLRDVNQRFDIIVKNAPIVFWSIGKDRRVTFLAGKGLELLNVTPTAWIGQPFNRSKSIPYQEADVEAALNGKTTSSIVNVNGMTFDVWYTPTRDQRGNITGVVSMAMQASARS